MNNMNHSRQWIFLASAAVAALALATPGVAAADFTVDFGAGQACVFALGIDGSGGHQVYREFKDKDGNVVRSISAGTGSALTFTNLDTGATLSTKSNGAVGQVAYNPDGSSTWTMTGHNILILFPTDVPAGPSTTLYVGRVVFTVDTAGNFTLQSQNGRATDICGALS